MTFSYRSGDVGAHGGRSGRAAADRALDSSWT